MRSNAIKLLALALALAGAIPASAQITNVVDWNSPWRYHQGGVLPAPDWMTNTYSDATWHTGNGALGFPVGEGLAGSGAAINTVLNQNTNGAQIITYYFRTTFNLPTTNGVTLTASNVIDDGAVFYLNGREVTRLAMPAGAVNYDTIATRANDIGDAGHGVETFAIPISFARVGTNVLAVEVHQGSVSGSSDAVMGSKVIANVPQPPVIVTNLQDVTVDAGRTAAFSVFATGSAPLTYRWYSNNVQIAGATGPTYTTPTTTLTMDGWMYYVVVSNQFGRATSATARLTVQLDDDGPLMVQANVTDTNRIEVRFDETVARSITNLNNWTVHLFGTTNVLMVTNVFYGVNQVRLTLNTNVDEGSNYVVCAYNIEDTRTPPNIRAVDCIGAGQLVTTNIFPMGGVWAATFTPPATNWTSPTYVLEDHWGTVIGVVAFDQSAGFNPCEPVEGSLPIGATTYYFRQTFSMGAIPASTVTLNLQYVVDDGAIFYLNGTEIFRLNMPAGPVTSTTLASSRVDNGTCLNISATVPASLFRVGSVNVLAAEVHQIADEGVVETDVSFDAALGFSYRRTADVPDLLVTRPQPNTVRVSWVGTGWLLQTATNISGPWNNQTFSVVGGTNRYDALTNSAVRRFFRLRNP